MLKKKFNFFIFIFYTNYKQKIKYNYY
jgi:hypothetical protein